MKYNIAGIIFNVLTGGFFFNLTYMYFFERETWLNVNKILKDLPEIKNFNTRGISSEIIEIYDIESPWLDGKTLM